MSMDTINIIYPGTVVIQKEKDNILDYVAKCLKVDRDHKISIQIQIKSNK